MPEVVPARGRQSCPPLVGASVGNPATIPLSVQLLQSNK